MATLGDLDHACKLRDAQSGRALTTLATPMEEREELVAADFTVAAVDGGGREEICARLQQ